MHTQHSPYWSYRPLSKFLAASLAVAIATLPQFSPFPAARAASVTWDPTLNPTAPAGGTGTWDPSTTGNWSDGTNDATWNNTGSNLAVFSGTAGTVTVSGSVSALGLQFLTTGYNLSGGTLTLGSSGIDGSSLAAGTITIGGVINLGAAQSWNVGAGATLTTTGNVGNGGFLLTNSGAGSASIGGIISGAGGLAQTGSGILTLSGVNTFTGGTTISSGTVSISANLNLGATGSAVSLNGGTLKQTGGAAVISTQVFTVGSNGGAMNISGKQYVFNTANTLLGSGTLTITGGAGTLADGTGFLGNLALNAVNSFNGNVVLQNGGNLEINSSSAVGTGVTYNVNSNGELIVDTGSTIGSAITVNGGELSFNNGAFGVFAGNVALAGNATIRLANFFNTTVQNGTIAGNISGAGGLTISNFGATLTLTGSNSYTGATVIGSGATLLNVMPTSRTYANVISGAGALTKAGIGTLTLTGTNTYTGTTTVSGGALQIGDGSIGGMASTALTFGGSGLMNFNKAAGTSQSMGALTFSSGAGTIQSTYGTGSGNSSVTFASLAARTAGATGNFVSSGGINGTSNSIILTGAAAGFINQGEFFNGADYAVMDGTGTFVRALAYGTDTNAAAADTITASNHVKLTATPASRAGDTLLTLNLAGSGVGYAMSSGTLTLSSGGLIKSGGGSGTISGGAGVSTGGATELVVRTDAANDALTISTPIFASTGGLTKTGLGTLTLSGLNSYTGTTTVDEGTLTLTGTYSGGGDWTVRNTGTLNLNGAVTTAGVLNLAPTAGGVAVANVSSVVTLANGKTWAIGNASNLGVGVLNVSTGANITGGNNAFNVGNAGFGVINLTGGNVTPGAFLVAGVNSGNTGIWNIAGGTVSTTGNNGGTVGIAGTGVMNISSGSYTSTDATANGLSGIYIGENSGGNGTLNLWGTGVGNFGGASTSVALNIGRNNGASGVVNLGAVLNGGSGTSGGGTINATRVQKTGATATGIFNFHGGTLKAGTTITNANATFMTGLTNAYVWNEGGIVDNNSQSITIGQALLAPTGSGVNTITLGGSTTGFTPGATPLITIYGGGGTGATAIGNVDASGNLTVTITNPGTGYTSTPFIAITGNTSGGITSATATLSANTSGGLTFQGAGTTTLSGANTYTGGSTVNSGTVALGASNVLADTGAVTVNGGAFNIGANSDTVGTVTLQNGLINGTTGVLTGSAYAVQSGTAAAILGGSGANLTKTTASTVNLTGVNTYTGATTVNAGTLVVGGTGSINGSSNITINGSGAKLLQTSSVTSSPAITLTQGILDGTGSVGAVTVGAGTGGIIANGNGTSTKLTLNSLTFNGGGTINLTMAGGATVTEGLTVSNALTLLGTSGSVVVNLTPLSLLNNITYNLISYGSFSGSLADFATGSGLTSRQSATFGNDTTNKFITLTIAGDAPKWTGLDSGNWVIGSTGASSNWRLITSGSATNYISGDVVLFDDSAAGTTSVDISAANVTPLSTTFSNSVLNYTLSGSNGFGIAGTGIMTKNGTAKVTLTGSNSYTGATVVNAGTLNLQHSRALGATSGVTVANGAVVELQGGVAVDARPITLNGAGLTASPAGALRNVSGTNSYAGLVTLGSNSTIQSDADSLALTNAGTITGSGFGLTLAGAGNGSIASIIGTGSGTVTKTGAGTWTLSGVNTYTGGTVINAGTIQAGNNSALGASTGALTFGASSNGKLQVNGNSLTIGSLSGDNTATVENSNATAGTLIVNNAGSSTFSGNLQNGTAGTLGFTMSGAGTQILSGSSSYSGATTISSGTLEFSNSTAMSSASALTIGSGATLSLRADADTTFTPASLTMTSGVTNNVLVNSITTGSNHAISIANTASVGNGNTTINVISSTGDTLKFNNSFGISGNGSSAFGGPTTAFNLNGADVILNGMNTTDGQMSVSSTTGNNLTINGGVSSPGSRTIGATVNSGVLTLNNTFTGAASGANWGFFVNLNGGMLNVNNAAAITNNNLGAHGNNGFIIAGGTLNNTSGSAVTLNTTTAMGIGFNGDFAFSTAGGTSANNLSLGTNAVTLGTTAGTTRTITTNGSATLTIGGAISNGTTANSLTKAGSGNLILNGVSTYTGITSVTAGTLVVGGALNGSTDVEVASAGTLQLNANSLIITSGTLNVGGFLSLNGGSSTVGKLAMNNGSTFGVAISGTATNAHASVSTTGGVSLATDAGGVTLSLNTTGYTPTLVLGDLSQSDHFTLTLGNGTAPTGSFVNAISTVDANYGLTLNEYTDGNGNSWAIFYGVDSTQTNAYQTTGNDIVAYAIAVPEPGTWALMLSGLGMLIGFQRSRRRKL